MSDVKASALAFIEAERLCVVSTVGKDGKPESAVVGFSINEQFEVMIGTSNESRKFQNIVQNSAVAVVFGPTDMQAVQYEGTARQLEGDELAERKKRHLEIHPWAAKYDADPTQKYFVIDPKWLRFVKSGPTTIGEVEFNT